MIRNWLDKDLSTILFIAWFSCGVVATTAGFLGIFYPAVSISLALPLLVILAICIRKCTSLRVLSIKEKIILIAIVAWWLLHLIQVFTPETGFDAVWYHLPLAKVVNEAHRFIGTLEFYQSFNPQFSDSFFYLGFAAIGEVGTKIVAYLFGLSTIVVTYFLSKKVLNKTWSLLVVLLISGFQVISWQSASFYVDVAKAYWELSSLLFLLSKPQQILKAGFSFGASLATKLFSIALLPVMILITLLQDGKKTAIHFSVAAISVALPFYIFAYQISGNPFYSLFEHVSKLQEIGGSDSTINYIVLRTVQLPLSLYQMIVNREYTTPLLLLFIPLVITYWEKLHKDKLLFSLTIFSLYQLALWWWLPPTSVRYALSGFITATIVTVTLVNWFAKQHKLPHNIIVLFLILCGLLFMPIRVYVAARSAAYLLHLQTKDQYLKQFLDGNIDTHLKKWHRDVFFSN